MADRGHPAGSLPVRRAVSEIGVRLGLPLWLTQVAVFVALVIAGWLALFPALIGLLCITLANVLIFGFLARNLESMAGWLVDQDEESASEPPVLRHWVAAEAIEGMMNGVYGLLHRRDQRIAHLTVETGRMLDTLPDPLFLVSRTRRVVHLNRAARALFGESSLGLDVSRLVRNPRLEGAINGVLAGNTSESAEITVTAGQVERLFSVDTAPLPVGDHGGPAAMAMFHDITEIRRTEQMRVDFVANASHEIRSPLATLIGCIETLRGPAREDLEAQGRFLDMMDDQGNRMARLVEDLLSLSRIELREHAQPAGKIAVDAMLERLRTSLLFQAEEKGMTIDLDLEEGLRPVRGDEGEVEQATYNLISNAIKYGRRETPVLISAGLAENPPGHLRLNDGPLVWIAVRDQGEGIGAQHIPRLTERFYRIDTARSREMGGTGLGLAIVKHVLNRHRGELHITSELGKGSEFTLWLPAVAGT